MLSTSVTMLSTRSVSAMMATSVSAMLSTRSMVAMLFTSVSAMLSTSGSATSAGHCRRTRCVGGMMVVGGPIGK